ncbi:MAG: PHP domain-containing protein, partial [Clostridia bacterium]|nr:PHP domain-containing protein [Clostridia bacterium]
MTNEAKLVKDVFRDYESKGSILDCAITNVSIFKKSNKLVIDLKSNKKIQVGERLEFEYYLKSKFRVQEVQINIEEEEKSQVKTEKGEEKQEDTPIIIGNKKSKISEKTIKIKDINIDSGRVVISGKIIKQDLRELKTGNFLLSLNVFDGSSTITCKSFINKEDKDKVAKKISEAPRVTVSGDAEFDPYSKEVVIKAKTVIETKDISETRRQDFSDVKRVELHMHTQMSQMDGVTSAEDLINRARSWGMKAIAITDHGVVQSFPAANHVVEDNNGDIKVIYGVEAYLVPDGQTSVYNSKNQDIDTEYCIFDIETTGLSFRTEKITEIGAIKIKNGEVIDTFECFVNPEKPIPYEVIKVTHITDDMVRDAETIEKVLPKFLEFVGDSVLVAHNANFDIGFIRHFAKMQGIKFDNTY